MKYFIKSFVVYIYGKLIASVVTKFNLIVTRRIPVYNLSEIHIKNARLLKDRGELLRCLPQCQTVAEIGVNRGDFSRQILDVCKPQKLHLVDLWGKSESDKQNLFNVESVILDSKNINCTTEVHIGYSVEVVKEFKDFYFDWIYIDTDHTYKTTIAELEAYKNKVVKGGIIAGHDYTRTNWIGVVRFGVIEAVHEFCLKNRWEIIYLTMEINNPSFAIREILENE